MQHDHAQQGRRRRNWCWWCQSMSWQQGQSFFQRAHIASIHCDLPSTSGFPPSKDISDRTYIRIVWVPWRGNREVYNDHSSDDATKVTTTTTYIRIVIVVFPPLSLIEYSLRYDNNNDSVVMAFSPVDGVEKNTHTDALPSVALKVSRFCLVKLSPLVTNRLLRGKGLLLGKLVIVKCTWIP